MNVVFWMDEGLMGRSVGCRVQLCWCLLVDEVLGMVGIYWRVRRRHVLACRELIFLSRSKESFISVVWTNFAILLFCELKI